VKLKTILVTGGAGYIGSHTVVQLLNAGFEVIIADDLSNSRLEVIDSIKQITGKDLTFIKADLCNDDEVSAIFKEHSIDAVIHFAAKKLVGESVEKPLMYYHVNLISLMNVIDNCIKSDVRNFVFSSSCSVYGQPEQLPVSEDAPLQPAESPYGNTKKIAEDILKDTSKVTPLNVISLRYFNPVGAHDSALIGEYPLNAPSNLMPVITQVAAGKRDKLKVFGSDYNTIDGTCVRDYIHVVDLAEAHIAGMRYLENNAEARSFDVFNIGTGEGMSVLQIINTFESVNGIKLNYDLTDRRSGDVEKVYGDTTKANEVLSWKATHSLEQMVSSAWNWEKKLMSNLNV
jgi:UDP-glucose 4-epimerase